LRRDDGKFWETLTPPEVCRLIRRAKTEKQSGYAMVWSPNRRDII